MGLKEEHEAKIVMLITALKARLGRLPTEDEVVGFMSGDADEQRRIWNQETGNKG